jgi:hypothetical protein
MLWARYLLGSRSEAARQKLTCVWCRAPWATSSTAGSSRAGRSAEGYLNLADVAGVNAERDTSSCKSVLFMPIGVADVVKIIMVLREEVGTTVIKLITIKKR